jgi:predicted ATPase/class 3 adenylate cyclase
MAELPSGTVTFLFSDVEGSTRLLTRLRGRYAEVLAEHRRLLRAAFDEHDGREVGTEGDAFFVAFVRASDAIAAAVSAQRSLASGRWPEGVEVRVRIGVHTGEAQVRLGDYVGLDVHRAARICAAGHGGQVLISSSTRELVADELPSDVALRDLGEHRLKDLDRPERLFQLAADDLPADFAPLRAAAAADRPPRAGVLPRPLDRTIGRERDIREIADRIRLGSVRLLTLTGAGGVGKTRLAVDAAHELYADYADGARFVSLAALRAPDEVPAAVAQALEVVPLPGDSPHDSVARFLSAKHMLMVLDNCEHVLAAMPFVSRLLADCPALTVLATSREPLAVGGEARYVVAPLAFPPPGIDPDAIANAPAVELFAERAHTHDSDFALTPDTAAPVAEICRRVDGLPLAVELAAARCVLLSPAEIAARLDAALAVLAGGRRDAPARQQTLRATIDWSHALLPEDDRTVFMRFAVFAGGATIDAAEAVTGARLDGLDGLVAKSLLVRQRSPLGPTRLVMLATIRAYALERLARSAEHDTVRERHCRYYLALVERHGSDQGLRGMQRTEHLARLDADINNVHAALRWALDRREAEKALAIVAAFGDYCSMRGRHGEALRWINEALALPAPIARPGLRVRALITKSWIARWVRPVEPMAAISEADTLARELDDPLLLAQVLQARAKFASFANELDACEAFAREAMRSAKEAGAQWEIARSSEAMASAAKTPEQLRERVDRAATLLSAAGAVYQVASLYTSAAYMALVMRCDLDAKVYADRARLPRELDDPEMTMVASGNLGLASLFTGDTDAAERAFRDQLMHCRDLVAVGNAGEGLLGLAGVAVAHGDLDRAAQLVGAAAATPGDQQAEIVGHRLNETFFKSARARHGPETWHAAFEKGATLSFEDAIAYALEEPRA